MTEKLSNTGEPHAEYLKLVRNAFEEKKRIHNALVPPMLLKMDFEDQATRRYPVGMNSVKVLAKELDNWECYSLFDYQRLCQRYVTGWRTLYQKLTKELMQEILK